jgi:hypothetical protein
MGVMRRQLIPQKYLAHPVSFLIDIQHLSSTHQVANSSATAEEESLGIPGLEKDLRQA